ncbi:hypothetical protein P43SY_001579 [Pythium insidiosum]|uniref:Uncharacterized protein n=1 Tax=Pythium insidiosum TaxID=114742 RepID=A0AAD5LLV3_PYTIN|nr:hypothetical protein P43SY_001579 [Pythium insidiosum]
MNERQRVERTWTLVADRDGGALEKLKIKTPGVTIVSVCPELRELLENDTVVAQIRVTSNDRELLEGVDVRSKVPYRTVVDFRALRSARHFDCAGRLGNLLTEIHISDPKQLRSVAAAAGAEVVIQDDVLCTVESQDALSAVLPTLKLAAVQRSRVFVACHKTPLRVRRLDVIAAGDSAAVLTLPALSASNAISLAVAGAGEIDVATTGRVDAGNVNLSVVGDGRIRVHVRDNALQAADLQAKYDPVADSDTAHTTAGFDGVSLLSFQELVGGATYDNSPNGKVRKWTLDAFAPIDGVNGPSATSSGSPEATFSCSVMHFHQGGADNFFRWRFKLPIYPGSVEVRYRIGQWTRLALGNALKLNLRLQVDDLSASIEEGPQPGPDLRLFQLGGTRAVVVPTVAWNPTQFQEVGVDLALDPTSGSYDAMLTIKFLDIQDDLLFALLFIDSSFDLTGQPYPLAPQIVVPSPPSPTPSPVAVPEPNVPSTNMQPASSLNAYPAAGVVEVCFSPDCNALDGSLAFALDRVVTNASVNQGEVNGELLMDLQDVHMGAGPWVTTPTADDLANTSYMASTIYALGCVSGCAARTTSATEFAGVSAPDKDDTVAVAVEFRHLWAAQSIHGTFENTPVPYGGVRLNASVRVATTGPALSGMALKLLVLAFEKGAPVTNVSISQPQGTMYVKRVHLGSDMFIDVPTYASVDGSDMSVDVTARAVTTGEYQDLIELSLVLGSSVLTQFSSVSSVATLDFSASNSWMPSAGSSSSSNFVDQAFGPLVKSSDGRVVPTRLMTLARGTFFFCGDADCSRNTLVGFSGLASTEGVTVRRFGGAPALMFPAAAKTTRADGVETYGSMLNAWIPQSRQRPPVPYDVAKLATYGSEPVFGAMVEQFLSSGILQYAGHPIEVPRGAVKFSVTMSKWNFASATDYLVMNMTLSSRDFITGQPNAGLVMSSKVVEPAGPASRQLRVTVSDGTTLDLPLRAMVDGAATTIDVSVSTTASGEITVSMTFPPFKTLFYDPVLSTEDLQAAMVRRGKRPKRRVKSWVASGILYGVLGHALVLSAAHCAKHLRWKALDLSYFFD